MDLYTKTAYELSKRLTLAYSSSFGISSRLFSSTIRGHIYAIYGLVRIADEIVDTNVGEFRLEQLDEFEAETYIAMTRGYSTNMIIHSFALTAKKFNIKKSYVSAFFKSMRLDLSPQTYTQKLYETYIYGSAEVIGLMCLRVFCHNDEKLFIETESGARSLGAAYQKINFLRDFASDYHMLHRVYFPNVTYDGFNDASKKKIVKDIQKDLQSAKRALVKLPRSSRIAVQTSLTYYKQLLTKLSNTPAVRIKNKRVRIHNGRKLLLLMTTTAKESLKK